MKTALMLSGRDCQNPEFLDIVKRVGFSAVGVTYDDSIFAQSDVECALFGIRSNLETAGLSCTQAILPALSSEDAEKRISLALRTMPILGASWGSVQPLSALGSDAERMMQNVPAFTCFLALAEKFEVGIAVENPMPVQMQSPQRFCAEPDSLCAFVDGFNHPLLGVCWNFGHANHLGRDHFGRDLGPEFDHDAALKKLGDRIKTVLISDNFGDGHHRLPMGIGKITWQPHLWSTLLKTVQDLGLSVPLCMDYDLEQGRRLPNFEENFLAFCAKSATAYMEEVI